MLKQLNNISSLFVFLLIIAASFYVGGKCQSPEIITKTKTVTVIETETDTVYVTQYIEVIPDDEQEQRDIDSPDDVDDRYEDGFRNIYTTFSDSLLVASHYIQIEQESQDITQTSFTYMMKQRLVREREIHLTTKIHTITTETRTIKEGMYFQAGVFSNLESAFPVVSMTTRNKTTLIYGYDPFLSTHNVGILIKF
jgi:hypothetical protein